VLAQQGADEGHQAGAQAGVQAQALQRHEGGGASMNGVPQRRP
jgi:hypothetical protein